MWEVIRDIVNEENKGEGRSHGISEFSYLDVWENIIFLTDVMNEEEELVLEAKNPGFGSLNLKH